MNFLKWSRLYLFVVGLLLLMAAERYLLHESYHLIIRWSAFASMVVATISTWLIAHSSKKSDQGAEARCWKLTLWWQFLLLIGAGLYLAYIASLGVDKIPESLAQKALLASWLLCFVLGIPLAVGMELTLAKSVDGEYSEPERVSRAGKSWLIVGLLLALLTTINYVGSKRDHISDWSYLKATRPSESSKSLVQGLNEELEISVFYPKDNPVLSFVADYFDVVAALSPKVKLNYYDKDLEPVLSEGLKVSKNGIVVLHQGKKKKKINIGLSVRSARKVLSQLDSKFQKSFFAMEEQSKVIYFSSGHGELSWSGNIKNPLKKITFAERWLRNQNYKVEKIDTASGLAQEVPQDASMLIIAGPTRPFSETEVRVVNDYVLRGGRVLVLLDIDGDSSDLALEGSFNGPLYKWLQQGGISYDSTPLAHSTNYLRGTKTKLDHWFLFSNSFASHESLSSLTKNDEKVAVFAIRSGSFQVEAKRGNWAAFETVRSIRGTFRDLNKNYAFDEGKEVRKIYTLGAGAKIKTDQGEGRVIAFADASAISDGVLKNPGNLLYIAGSLQWLIGKDAPIAVASNEEDIKIEHSKKEDVVVFYGSVVLVPLLVLGAGAFVIRRRKRAISANVKGEKHAA